MKRKVLFSSVIFFGLACLVTAGKPAGAAEFYEAKNIRFIVGFAAAAGYDAYTRNVARYIGRHIPGHPSTVVENMDGAGSVIAANYRYNKAEKDGLTVGIWNSHNIFNQMMGDSSLRIDGRKFGWIGSPSKDSVACAIKAKLPVDYISGETIDQYVDRIYSISPDVNKRLEFLVKIRKTS